MRLVPCGSCGSKNRLPWLYLTGFPMCGRCGAGLHESAFQRMARGAYRKQGWIIGAVALAAGVSTLLALAPSLLLLSAALFLPAIALVDAVLRRRKARPVGGTTTRDAPREVKPEPTVLRQEEDLERRLRATILDSGARKRLLEAKRVRHPELSQAELIRLVLEEYERDRR